MLCAVIAWGHARQMDLVWTKAALRFEPCLLRVKTICCMSGRRAMSDHGLAWLGLGRRSRSETVPRVLPHWFVSARSIHFRGPDASKIPRHQTVPWCKSDTSRSSLFLSGDVLQVSWLVFAYLFSFGGAMFYGIQQTKLFKSVHTEHATMQRVLARHEMPRCDRTSVGAARRCFWVPSAGFAAKLKGFAPMSGEEQAEAENCRVPPRLRKSALHPHLRIASVEGKAQGGDHRCHWERARGCLRGLGPPQSVLQSAANVALSRLVSQTVVRLHSEDFASKRHLVEAVLDQEVGAGLPCLSLA